MLPMVACLYGWVVKAWSKLCAQSCRPSNAQQSLFLHDLALAGERFVDQARHAIGFEPQGQRQVLGRQRFPGAVVFVGVGVALPAHLGNHRRMALGLNVLEPLNIRCSKRWANPVRPAPFFEPT
jgi:hypothetical protein